MARTATRQSETIDTSDIQAELGFAPLDADAIARQTDDGSFSRGRGYARSKRIFGAVRRDAVLRSRCRGSSGGPYLVEATLAKAGKSSKHNPVSYSCDCPRGGFCKHVVALLLTWVNTPEAFDVRPPLAETLANRSQEELVALIELMLGEAPELEDLLELPIPVSGAPAIPADEAAIRRQVTLAMQDDEGFQRYRGGRGFDYDDYYPASRIAGRLEMLVSFAEESASADDWPNALRVFAVLVEELAPRLAGYYDGQGSLTTLLFRAETTLAAGLDAQDGLPEESRLSSEERARLIDVLFALWKTSMDAGGLDLGEEGKEAIARGASPEEQRRISERLREVMSAPATSEFDATWKKQAAIGFLSMLAGDAGLSEEELMEEYRNAELWDDAAQLLLKMHRVEEAIALAARRLTAAHGLIPFADQLRATGDPKRIEQAIALVDDQLWEHEGENVRNDQALREWLALRYAEQGKPEKALELARSRFTATPGKPAYDAVKALALHPNQPGDPWPELRTTLIDALRKRGDVYGLIDIFLEEGKVNEAVKALKRAEKASTSGQLARTYGWNISPDEHAARVAEAAEAEFPDAAIEIYQRLAERMIQGKQRTTYQVAARHLGRVQSVLEASGRSEEWPPLIADVRGRYRTYRALQDELAVLGSA